MGTQQCSQCLGSGAGPTWGWRGSTGPLARLGFDPKELVGSLPHGPGWTLGGCQAASSCWGGGAGGETSLLRVKFYPG